MSRWLKDYGHASFKHVRSGRSQLSDSLRHDSRRSSYGGCILCIECYSVTSLSFEKVVVWVVKRKKKKKGESRRMRFVNNFRLGQ